MPNECHYTYIHRVAHQKSGEFLTGIHRLVKLDDSIKRNAPEGVQQYLKIAVGF